MTQQLPRSPTLSPDFQPLSPPELSPPLPIQSRSKHTHQPTRIHTDYGTLNVSPEPSNTSKPRRRSRKQRGSTPPNPPPATHQSPLLPSSPPPRTEDRTVSRRPIASSQSPPSPDYTPHDLEDLPSAPPNPHTDVPLPHWSTTNTKRARFHTVCPACHDEIEVGDRILYQFQYRRFVHESCAPGPRGDPQYAPPPHPNPPQAMTVMPDPLAPGSPVDSLAPSYRAEAVRWVQYHAGHPRIPGIHEGFSQRTLEHYLRYRSETCKDLSVICSKLKKMGEVCGFVLCTSKYQQPSIQYQQIRSAKMDINKKRRLEGRDAETNEALATGNLGCVMVLSGYDVRSAKRMQPLHPLNREFISIHIMLHSGCVRFGLFRFSDILREHLVFSSVDNCYVLQSTWRKTRKSNRPYSIKFKCKPESGNPSKYAIPGARGPTFTSAGKIITWYLQAAGLMNAPGRTLLFPHLCRLPDRRVAFTRWLQSTYAALLPAGSDIPRRIRPHSSRAGWATDRARLNTNRQTIMMEGRWRDPRAMNRYIRTSLRDLLNSTRHRDLPDYMKYGDPTCRRHE